MHCAPFRAEHVLAMSLQEAQRQAAGSVTLAGLRTLEGPNSHTLFDGSAPLACCGAAEIWTGRAYLWAFFSDKVTARNFPEIFNWAKLFVDNAPFVRLEAAVVAGFRNGERFLKCLGFRCYDPDAEAFTHDGLNASLWVKVRQWKH